MGWFKKQINYIKSQRPESKNPQLPRCAAKRL